MHNYRPPFVGNLTAPVAHQNLFYNVNQSGFLDGSQNSYAQFNHHFISSSSDSNAMNLFEPRAPGSQPQAFLQSVPTQMNYSPWSEILSNPSNPVVNYASPNPVHYAGSQFQVGIEPSTMNEPLSIYGNQQVEQNALISPAKSVTPSDPGSFTRDPFSCLSGSEDDDFCEVLLHKKPDVSSKEGNAKDSEAETDAQVANSIVKIEESHLSPPILEETEHLPPVPALSQSNTEEKSQSQTKESQSQTDKRIQSQTDERSQSQAAISSSTSESIAVGASVEKNENFLFNLKMGASFDLTEVSTFAQPTIEIYECSLCPNESIIDRRQHIFQRHMREHRYECNTCSIFTSKDEEWLAHTLLSKFGCEKLDRWEISADYRKKFHSIYVKCFGVKAEMDDFFTDNNYDENFGASEFSKTSTNFTNFNKEIETGAGSSKNQMQVKVAEVFSIPGSINKNPRQEEINDHSYTARVLSPTDNEEEEEEDEDEMGNSSQLSQKKFSQMETNSANGQQANTPGNNQQTQCNICLKSIKNYGMTKVKHVLCHFGLEMYYCPVDYCWFGASGGQIVRKHMKQHHPLEAVSMVKHNLFVKKKHGIPYDEFFRQCFG